MILIFNIQFPSSIPFRGELFWLGLILPVIFITAILNEGKTLKKSIKKGAIIGILGWLFFLIYEYIYESFSGYVNWYFFWALMIYMFFPLILISSIIGLVTSYFVRKQIKKKKEKV
jgi:hypothetical protein